ncbi:dTDP-4-amino-4,6-dideoxygalactose transaminase [Clostridium acidisoli DSM 12555]|uniref:dTDP-4-amino-4,6-dideoxygalactose transaminase n=1 Tax=Clostridium acidisoli DSM 12555 TaxID=1121291 RepID=A0A1W1XGV8_9CLOT|nr:DegT/DnrJ/EryC1/StrS family aminotransferase [Clostridium acidisoli]SMC23223.1 dTDP-4-amino-4,6-dideoxygalactose transaminase [Clostridium acidisoli DSM 12555]
MAGHIKPIGGEFWFDEKLFNKALNNFENLNAIFLSGGQSAIQFIIEDIDFKHDEYILVPAYLCRTILYNFERKNIKFIFYEINEDLSINLEDIQNKIYDCKVKAIFFVNYFGFYHNDKTIEFLKSIQETGVVLIEDAVQMFWFKKMKKFIGNYVFNSYRKFLPADGSVVLCDKYRKFEFAQDEYYKLMNEARFKKTEYIQANIGEEGQFLNLFNMADKAYYKRKNINGIDNKSKEFLNKVNYELIKRLRISNYNYLHDRLKNFNDIKILFDKKLIEDNVPLGFPILINNRDFVRKELRKYSIFCPVHWDVRKETWISNFNKTKKITNSILTIPIDWRYNNLDMEYFLDKITIISLT